MKGSSSGPQGDREPGLVEARRQGIRELAPEHLARKGGLNALGAAIQAQK